MAFQRLPNHRFNNFKSQALSPSRRHTQRVFIAPVGVNSRNSPARSRSLPTKTPRMFNLAPSSEWFRPNHTSHHKAFSRLPSLGNCLQHMHSVVPSSPSTHDPVQVLSCISLRRLLEMPEPVPELSNFLVLHAPSSDSILLALHHDQNCGLTPLDQSTCHTKSAWLLVTFQFWQHQCQPIYVILETVHHIIILATFSLCHNSKNRSMNESVATIIEIFGPSGVSVANPQSTSIT